MKGFKAKQLDPSLRNLTSKKQQKLLQSVLNYMEQDFLELRSEFFANRKDFLKRMQELKKKQKKKQKESSPNNVIIPDSFWKKRKIGVSDSVKFENRKGKYIYSPVIKGLKKQQQERHE